ncbi:MAG: hypothetical protein ACJ76N_17345 [Thermoanaerobaculia bacterium]
MQTVHAAPLTGRLLVPAVVCLAFAAQAAAAPPDLDALNWAGRHYDACLARRFPAHEEMFESPLEHQATLTLRAQDDCAFERQVTIFQEPGGAVVAEVMAVEGAPLDDQMVAIHKAQPGLNPAEVCARVKIRTFRPAGEDARRVAEAFHKLMALRVPLLPGVITRIHGTRYSLWLSAGEVSSHLVFTGPLEGIQEPDEMLASWAFSLFKTLGLTCPAKASSN